MSAATFSDLVNIVRHTGGEAWKHMPIKGTVALDSPELLEALRRCHTAADDTDLTVIGKAVERLSVGDSVDIEVRSPRLTFGVIAENLDTLLDAPAAHLREPADYFICTLNYYNRDKGATPAEIVRYRAVTELVSTLRQSAAFLDENEESMVFLRDGKFDIPVKYTRQNLLDVDPASIRALASVPLSDSHRKERLKILAEAVGAAAQQYPEDSRFAKVLLEADSVKQHYDRGFDLYASGFSYEKLKNEVEAARIEYTSKIHKTVSDIQNQLLGIPVATVIVATQMKANTAVGSDFWVSAAVLLGSFVFMLLMHFLLRNQRHTLAVIKEEIVRQHRQLEKAPKEIAAQLEGSFSLLVNRVGVQVRVLYSIEAIVVIGFLLACFFFYRLSTPAQEFVGRLLALI